MKMMIDTYRFISTKIKKLVVFIYFVPFEIGRLAIRREHNSITHLRLGTCQPVRQLAFCEVVEDVHWRWRFVSL
jgi:hypothetical protein